MKKETDFIVELFEKWVSSANGQGWLKLVDILETASKDPVVSASPGASEFLEIIIDLASDSLSSPDAITALLPLDAILPNGQVGLKAKIQRALAAKQPRPKDPFKQAIQAAMKTRKRQSDTFKTFMQSWQQSPIRGLSITPDADGKNYAIADEVGELGTHVYAWGTLQKMYVGI